MSPFLVVINMEMLSKRFQRMEEHSSFKFHPKCNKMKLIDIAFADDLFVFSRSDPASVRLVKEYLDEFGKESELDINIAKSEVYMGGLMAEEEDELAELMDDSD